MAERLATLRQKGGGIESNLFCSIIGSQGGTSWAIVSYGTTVNDPNGTSTGTMLDPDFGHLDNGTIVVDKAVSKAYISGQAYAVRNTSGTIRYTGLRVMKNGTLISGTQIMGDSGTNHPSFRRVQTSFAVGDIIEVQLKVSSSGGGTGAIGVINIVTDD